MSQAWRLTKWRRRAASTAGQPGLTQRRATSCGRRTTGSRQTGHRVGGARGCWLPSRAAGKARRTLGMMSPPLTTTTRSPGRMSLRASSSQLCRVARLTVVPARLTGSSSPTGVITPVRPTCRVISRKTVTASSALNL